jgi:hypothetical protein
MKSTVRLFIATALLVTSSCTQENKKHKDTIPALELTPYNKQTSFYDGRSFYDTTLTLGNYSFQLRSTIFSPGEVCTAISIRKDGSLIYNDSTDTDIVEKMSVQDLDNDSLPDFFYSSSSTGSGAYGDAVVYCVNSDLSVSIVRLDCNEDYDHKNYYYGGHDYFSIVENTVRREFPLYNPGDAQCCPSHGYRVIVYRLENNDGRRKFVSTRTLDFPPRQQKQTTTEKQ